MKENLWAANCCLHNSLPPHLLLLKFFLLNDGYMYIMYMTIMCIDLFFSGDLNRPSKAHPKSRLKQDESSLLSMPENMKMRGFSNFSDTFLFF